MTELSPAAIAVDDALAACIQLQGEIVRARPIAAAALRAAVEHLGYELELDDLSGTVLYVVSANALLAVADELEN